MSRRIGWQVHGWAYPVVWWARRKPRSCVRQWAWDVTDAIKWRGAMRYWRKLRAMSEAQLNAHLARKSTSRRRPTDTDHPLVGKRINHGGHAAEITHVNDGLCWVKYDDYTVGGVVLESIAAGLPELVARASFDHRPGDRG